jgi:phage-related protein
MALVLTFPVETGVQGNVSFRVRTIRFGEGYQQDTGDGLNGKEQNWPVTAFGPQTDIQPLIDFLDARGGYQSFLWTPPRGVQGLYKCKSYTTTDVHGSYVKLSATFERSFQP